MGDYVKLSDLQNKKIIRIKDGTYIGIIIDVNITKDGKIESLVVEKSKILISRFTSKDEFVILWNQIEKIGEDVILCNI